MTTEVRGDSAGPVKPPTLYDVAALAGVSHQTVSRVVKGQTNIRLDLRERVEDAIETLKYKPNLAARSLATSKAHRIGALVYEILEVGPTKIMQGASAGAREAGYLLDIVSLDPRDHRAIEQAIALINQNDLAGILVFAPTDPVIQALEKVQFAVPVYVETEANERINSSEPTPNELGMRALVDHLSDLGHERYFHISGPLEWLAARGRLRGYETELERFGHTSLGTSEGNWTSESGYDAAMRMPLDGVTAVVVGNDQMSLGVIAALQDRGVRVPEDISVVGFDDIPESRYFRPSLTTVRLDFDKQGRIAINRLLNMIDPEQGSEALSPLRPELLVRDSSGPVRSR